MATFMNYSLHIFRTLCEERSAISYKKLSCAYPLHEAEYIEWINAPATRKLSTRFYTPWLDVYGPRDTYRLFSVEDKEIIRSVNPRVRSSSLLVS
jgi:hypothetical protein